MEPLLLLGSLVAILALAGLAAWLKLGRAPVLENEEQARIAADQAIDGFAPTRFGLDASGHGALLEDDAGRILLLKPHGNFFAGRLLGPLSQCRRDGTRLTIGSGERLYGDVAMTLGDAEYWADAIDRLGAAGDA